MSTHIEIIERAGGYKALAERLTAGGAHVEAERARFWSRRGSIPPELWKAVADAGLATLEELAEAAAGARRADPTPDTAHPAQDAA